MTGATVDDGPAAMTGRRATVARALADAFLAGDWTRPALIENGGRVLGARPAWLGPVVTEVLRGYRRAPRDRPRELTSFLTASPRLRAAFAPRAERAPRSQPASRAEAPRRPIRMVRRPVGPTSTVRSPWHTPVLDDLTVLARFLDLTDDELDWYADRREINRKVGNQRLRHYRYTWLPGRLIEAPKPRLRALQRRLLADLLGRIPVHGSVHGFVPGRGAHTFAAAHAGRPTVVRVDLTAFFTSVTAPRVYGVLRAAGYPEPVAHTLAALATTRTPMEVLRAAPGNLRDRTYRLSLLRHAHLPQGAPTSPALANLCGYRLDRRLAGLAGAFGAVYTRYADDLAFSGELPGSSAATLVARVSEIAAEEGFRAHPAKTRIRRQGDRQELAGLVVNHHAAVPRAEYDRLRAILHHTARHGLASANRDGHPDFAAHLAGRVSWLAHRHPARAAKLQAMLARVPGG